MTCLIVWVWQIKADQARSLKSIMLSPFTLANKSALLLQNQSRLVPDPSELGELNFSGQSPALLTLTLLKMERTAGRIFLRQILSPFPSKISNSASCYTPNILRNCFQQLIISMCCVAGCWQQLRLSTPRSLFLQSPEQYSHLKLNTVWCWDITSLQWQI